MLWMETYLFYCSVRLGVILVALLVFIQVSVPATLLLVMDMDAVNPLLKLFENDYEYGKNYIVRKTINWIKNNVQAFTALAVTILAVHMFSCGLAIFGAFKLKKWCLLPFIINEFFRVIFCFTLHIVLMIILKKKLNLGLLIAVTLAGGFLILYLGYNWAASVALYQIIELIHTDRYRKLYGEDPFNPQLPPSYTPPPGYGTLENVRVLSTPRSGDIDEQKQRQTQGVVPRSIAQPPAVIAVLPVNYKNLNNAQSRYLNQVQKQQQHQQRSQQLPPQRQEYRGYETQQNDYNAEFGNWQWSELMVGRQRKAMIRRS